MKATPRRADLLADVVHRAGRPGVAGLDALLADGHGDDGRRPDADSHEDHAGQQVGGVAAGGSGLGEQGRSAGSEARPPDTMVRMVKSFSRRPWVIVAVKPIVNGIGRNATPVLMGEYPLTPWT